MLKLKLIRGEKGKKKKRKKKQHKMSVNKNHFFSTFFLHFKILKLTYETYSKINKVPYRWNRIEHIINMRII